MNDQLTHSNLRNQIAARLFAALIAVTAISPCFATTTTSTLNQAAQARMAAEAEQQALQGNFAEASKRFETLASQASKADHDHLALRAAWYAAQAKDVGKTQSLLDSTNKTLVGSDAALRTTITAALTLQSNQADRAIAMLDQIPLPLPDEVAPDVLAARSQALFATGRIVLALNAALERERMLKSAAAINQNHEMIWTSLKQAAGSGRDLVPPSGASRTVTGWMDLARAVNNNQRDPFAFNRAMNDWRAKYAGHPGIEFIVMNSIGTTPAPPNSNTGDHLALLLPLSGRQQLSGLAVRDGFLAAMLRQSANTRPVVQIYDTAQEGAVEAYRHAITDGANMVVGPLLKEDVQTLIAPPAQGASSPVSVPTLALNNAGDAFVAPAQLYQYSLDPEDEARQVAMRARAEGKTRAIVMVPNNEWGQRMQRAFVTELQAQGGSLIELRAYDATARDFVGLVTQLLAPRNPPPPPPPKPKELEYALGAKTPVSKIPEHRDDFDFVFIAAQAAQAKQLRPALRFMLPDLSIPVYSTSDAYEPGASTTSDLDGLRFTDMPWVINRDPQADAMYAGINRYWAPSLRARGRLYAFGADAYTLLDVLKAARPQLVAPVRGLTGLLAVDQAGHVRRQVEWAQIVKGQPQLLPEAFVATP